MTAIHHQFAEVDGHRIFYREAGPSDAPTIVLLHGYPTSSFMFRRLIPLLAEQYHVVAPDHLGFGFSDAPSIQHFAYTFDRLAQLTAALLANLNITRYAIYVQDYGAPIGWRLALENPSAITAIISQNGNAYDEGFVDGFWADVWAYAENQNEQTESAIRVALSFDAIKWQYVHGVPDPKLVDPDTWEHDVALISRPGNDLVQLQLFRDYATNPPLYPRLHEYFRASQVPLLAVWGENDEIFGPAGATAFTRDLPNAHIKLLPGGHFLLESHLDEVAAHIHTFLESTLNK
ncbi:pimeloyl-ACP methyl ester carboxylesterase [Tamaricihabitans halophyticus]|uniref:Pimeloyl-ACP methyl ester carboxylesterase n=1 Tax=Tamaricihabitans halophyticus TaxID=1262583 RepID=A0A4R2PYP2_9PSEU|nr:alpha/beta fold hydrolase [Tamaricihabitans halophyticus]TCP41217.1 pimeloyl-ACP methyl ester carboxylesterase [Tamaricihabitans halophyticus]